MSLPWSWTQTPCAVGDRVDGTTIQGSAHTRERDAQGTTVVIVVGAAIATLVLSRAIPVEGSCCSLHLRVSNERPMTAQESNGRASCVTLGALLAQEGQWQQSSVRLTANRLTTEPVGGRNMEGTRRGASVIGTEICDLENVDGVCAAFGERARFGHEGAGGGLAAPEWFYVSGPHSYAPF